MLLTPWIALVTLAGCAWLVERALRARPAEDGAQAFAWLNRCAAPISLLSSLFPVMLVTGLVLSCVGRLFAVESQSMVPMLKDADLVAASRFDLGWTSADRRWRIPAWHPLERGDVIVFRYPIDPTVVYVKRVIGLPGDTVGYDIEGGFTLNGQPLERRRVADFWFSETGIDYPRYEERLGSRNWNVINYTPGHRPARMAPEPGHRDLDRCHFDRTRVTCVVPEGRLFAVGDNRDRSVDSRDWGLVPEQLVLGRVIARLGNWKDAGTWVASTLGMSSTAQARHTAPAAP